MEQYILLVFKIIGSLIIVIPLIYILLKMGGSNLQKLQSGKFIKIYEKVALSKENQIVVAKIGEGGYVISSTNSKIEIMLKIEDKDLEKLESKYAIQEYRGFKDLFHKLFRKKEDKDE